MALGPQLPNVSPFAVIWNYVTGHGDSFTQTNAPTPQANNPITIPWQVSVILILGGTLAVVAIVKKAMN